jgi:hypothetical protein
LGPRMGMGPLVGPRMGTGRWRLGRWRLGPRMGMGRWRFVGLVVAPLVELGAPLVGLGLVVVSHQPAWALASPVLPAC